MIRYNLKCDSDHHFEAWFRSSSTFDEQVAAGEISCPLCASLKVAKALMAPAVASRKSNAPAPATPDQAAPQGDADQQAAAQALQMMTKLREHVEKNCDNVGDKFAEEARKMHYGETEKRDIYGEATTEESDALREEGIEAHHIPWLPRHDA